jgi:secreted trypsin-like serine protease
MRPTSTVAAAITLGALAALTAAADVVITPFILSGNVVPAGSKTYTTSLRASANATGFCGGSLITPTHILTAAHCSLGDIEYASVGTHYVNGTIDGEQILVVNQTIHPSFNYSSKTYDFMVLELAEASTFEPVTLAATDDSDYVVGETATVMGWGTISETGPQSYELLRVDVPVVSDADCALLLPIDDTMICAGGELNQDSCENDSGGPLILEGVSDNEDVLLGVVSWGYGCGMEGYPGVYSRVSKARSWLESVAPTVRFR